MNTPERNFEQNLEYAREQERGREGSNERAEVTERVMEATEMELELTLQRAEELRLTDQECMTELGKNYLQDALEMGIEEHILKGVAAQLESQKQQRFQAYEHLQSRLHKAA